MFFSKNILIILPLSPTIVWKQECKHTKNGDLPDKASTLFSVIGNSISSVCMITSLRNTLTAYNSSVPRRSANNILPYEPLPKTLIKLKSAARIISRLLILCVNLRLSTHFHEIAPFKKLLKHSYYKYRNDYIESSSSSSSQTTLN
uniref:Uncharacterized protein n=1 Tax=Glossina palpalis gambiensis TaxID=67801 RepID=A0A1B0BVR6_9MUSC